MENNNNGDGTTGNDSGGSITVNENGEPATMEKMTNAPTEAELGASIYPGATFDAENSGMVSSSNQEGQAFAGTAQFLTNDDFEKVVAFYQDKLGEPAARTSTSAGWWIGDVTTGNYTAVQVEQGDGNVKISIARVSASVK